MASRKFGVRNRHLLPHNGHRSILLDNFREQRYPNLQLGDIVSHVVEFAKDRDGSKFIQRKLDDATDNRKGAIFREMRSNLRQLILDPFGNFVVQKFFDMGTEVQRQEIIEGICAEFTLFSINKYGCRVVQTAIEKSPMQQQIAILQAGVRQSINCLLRDPNGNHVIQKCFRCLPPFMNDYLFQCIKPYIYDLCTDLYGCRIIQCILTHGTTQQRADIFEAILPFLLLLTQHRYGNYVISHALQFCDDRNMLIEFILKHVVALSQQKYASNVVEKCLNVAPDRMKEYAFQIICARDRKDLQALCIDAYANYVIQKLIESGSKMLITRLYERIQPFFNEMKRCVCGRKIIEMLTEYINQPTNN